MSERPMLCILNLRHHWQTELTEDGRPYRKCSRCGKEPKEIPPPAHGVPRPDRHGAEGGG